MFLNLGGNGAAVKGQEMEDLADVQTLFFFMFFSINYDVQRQACCHRSLCSRRLIRCQVECEYEDTNMKCVYMCI